MQQSKLWESDAERNDSFASSWKVTKIEQRPNRALLDVTLDSLSYPAQMEVVCDLLGNDPVKVRCWHGEKNREKWNTFTDRQMRRQDREFTAAIEWLIKKALLPKRERKIAELVTELRLLTAEEPYRREQIAHEIKAGWAWTH
jgi:hypothetical protein